MPKNNQQEPEKAEESQAPVDQQAQVSEEVNAPAGVSLGVGPDAERAKYFEMKEKNADVFKQFGEETYEQFIARVGSDGGFAMRVVNNFLGFEV